MPAPASFITTEKKSQISGIRIEPDETGGIGFIGYTFVFLILFVRFVHFGHKLRKFESDDLLKKTKGVSSVFWSNFQNFLRALRHGNGKS